mmetsp:Transcript_10390/g.15182  ORF Transcript_10390/g.15182 Transcript_10390/m.15182 type:complete len:99 (+) Transcript_10390:137-433(+)
MGSLRVILSSIEMHYIHLNSLKLAPAIHFKNEKRTKSERKKWNIMEQYRSIFPSIATNEFNKTCFCHCNGQWITARNENGLICDMQYAIQYATLLIAD